MLERLYIKDFAILDEITLEFSPGLTVITGETGAGKSILLQALSVALGAKGTKLFVKTGRKHAVVEATINDRTFRRLVSKAGRLKSYMEDEPLKEEKFRIRTQGLIDFHGQHEQQLIMNSDTHLDYLDSFCGLQSDVSDLTSTFQLLQTKKKQLNDLRLAKKHYEEKRELLEYQKQEIDNVYPQENEDVELHQEFKKLHNIEELISTIQQMTHELTDGERSLYNQLSSITYSLNSLLKIDSDLNSYSETLESALVSLQDASTGLTNYRSSLHHDNERLTEIDERLQAIESLLRKYGGTVASVILHRNEIEEELQSMQKLGEEEHALIINIAECESAYKNNANRIHKIRKCSLNKLSNVIEKEMQKLNMPNAIFQVRMTQKPDADSFMRCEDEFVLTTSRGIDFVEFYLSANPGEQPKPLTKIASGGEISRIMLAIKTVFQNNDPVQTMVFDEIDSGISGDAAEKVAESLVNLSKNKQVICITHLPQISQKAEYHLHVTKKFENGETVVFAEYI